MEQKEKFTRYEIARIIGARALQIAMDAPLLLKIPDEELKEMRFDSLKIAEKELNEGVLPITINRPTPKRHQDKLEEVKEEKLSDAEILKKEKEIEKEVSEDLDEYGLVEEDETKEAKLQQAEEKPNTAEEQ